MGTLTNPTLVAVGAGERVQRRTTSFPVLHLEREIPPAPAEVVVDGLVASPTSWPIADVTAMVSEPRVWDLHCVWGWTRPGCRWEGLPAGRLIDAARPLSEARYVLATAAGGAYMSCFPLHRARRALLAWRLDGAALTPEHGGPLRLVPPPTKWAYKGVKWIHRLTLVDEFTPGFWEEKVGDVQGDIPAAVLDHADDPAPPHPEPGGLDDRLSLEEVLAARGVPARDCRTCGQFKADADGRGFGWCEAHHMFVKLYHADADWHSQCQFQTIRQVRELG